MKRDLIKVSCGSFLSIFREPGTQIVTINRGIKGGYRHTFGNYRNFMTIKTYLVKH